MPDPHDDFTTYAHAQLPRLVTTAHLLSGATGDPREAADLVRRTLVGLRARWRRIPRDDVDFYVLRSLVKAFLRGARRQRALSDGVLKDTSARQRAVLVLLHREGLREAEVAQLLGWSAGAVGSRARRGLAVCGG
ncbi:sigma factor-like helix-turn-helix DNA-binding protein, partial [Streptomyces sp. MBT62]